MWGQHAGAIPGHILAHMPMPSVFPAAPVAPVAPVVLVAPVPAPVPVPVHPQAAPVHRKRARAVDVTSAEFLQGPRPTGDKDDAEYRASTSVMGRIPDGLPTCQNRLRCPCPHPSPEVIIYNMDDNTVRLGQRYDAQGGRARGRYSSPAKVTPAPSQTPGLGATPGPGLERPFYWRSDSPYSPSADEESDSSHSS